jgi:hypothetical protein
MKNYRVLFIVLGLGVLTSCIQPPKSKKKNCPDSQLSMMLNNENPSQICEDVSLYKCDVKVFSPDEQSSKSREDYCFGEDNSSCLFIDKLTFSTAEQKTSDQFSTEADFLPGGQYNYTEVICYHKEHLKEGLYQVLGEGSTVEMAIQKAIQSCKGSGK